MTWAVSGLEWAWWSDRCVFKPLSLLLTASGVFNEYLCLQIKLFTSKRRTQTIRLIGLL